MPKILIIDNNTLHLKKLEKLLPFEATLLSWKEASIEKTKDVDIIILTGGSHIPSIMGHEDIFAQELEIIRTTQVPIIGICFGCELIARALGATLKRLPERRSSIIEIITTDDQKILFEKPEKISVYEGHTWAIETLPPGTFAILAKSDDGPEIIKHRTLPLWGLQFHPENKIKETAGAEVFLRILKKYI